MDYNMKKRLKILRQKTNDNLTKKSQFHQNKTQYSILATFKPDLCYHLELMQSTVYVYITVYQISKKMYQPTWV